MYLGVQRWPLTEKVWRQFEIFDLVMKRAQVDPVCAARENIGKAIAEARNICLNCPVQERCQALLKKKSDPDEIMAFCPNSSFFTRCRLPQGDSR